MKRIVLSLVGLVLSLNFCERGWPQTVVCPDEETFLRWIDSYEEMPKAFIDEAVRKRLNQRSALGAETSINLLQHISYVPGERNQGNCGDCALWAATGVMEVALDVQNGIRDRLSIQFLHSCKTDKYMCCGGNVNDVTDWYRGKGFCIPWTNGGGDDRDHSKTLYLPAHAKVVSMVQEIFSGFSITGATYVAYTSTQDIVGFQLNGSADNTMLERLAAM